VAEGVRLEQFRLPLNSDPRSRSQRLLPRCVRSDHARRYRYCVSIAGDARSTKNQARNDRTKYEDCKSGPGSANRERIVEAESVTSQSLIYRKIAVEGLALAKGPGMSGSWRVQCVRTSWSICLVLAN